MDKFTAIGMMSGTSMDGIDAALIRSDGKDYIERGSNLFVPYNNDLRIRLKQGLVDGKLIKARAERPGALGALENEITVLHSEAVAQFLSKYNFNAEDIDLIGFHGQTILHRPHEAITVQLGDGQAIADATGIDVIFDMRSNDMKHGGQGAPLVPAYHRALARSQTGIPANDLPVVFVNIGGISNVTYVGNENELIAFDCGPGNVLIDQWMQQRAGKEFDEGGQTAKQGTVIEDIVEQYLADSYFSQPVPKSLDRLDFTPLNDRAVSVADGARSLARLTARGILQSVRHFPAVPALWVICGGGTMNSVVMDDLKNLAPQGAEVIS
ncbi:MAG: anhydro-N-acetylmuramic acid kinase, partial [Rhizobiaceae bacterium]|nr:anhydro-N-acetylmuramic acid kinase [Rhizobiaceae bacterium]